MEPATLKSILKNMVEVLILQKIKVLLVGLASRPCTRWELPGFGEAV